MKKPDAEVLSEIKKYLESEAKDLRNKWCVGKSSTLLTIAGAYEHILEEIKELQGD